MQSSLIDTDNDYPNDAYKKDFGSVTSLAHTNSRDEHMMST